MSLQFAPIESPVSEAEKPLFLGMTREEIFRIGELLVLAFVALLIVLLVLRPIVQRALGTPAGLPSSPGLQITGALPQLAAPGVTLDPALLSAQALPEPSSEVDQMINIAQIEGRVKASSVKKVGEIIEKHPEEAIAILRSWLYEAK
jgi:flagellar M-ring protein FliF